MGNSMGNTTRTATRRSRVFGKQATVPGLLLAFGPPGAVTTDRCRVASPFTVGRGSSCSLPLDDDRVSKRHFRIVQLNDEYTIEDLDSTNGTFVQGMRLKGSCICPDPAVIRVGREVMVFHANAGPMLEPPPPSRYGLLGPFHTDAIIRELLEVAHSNRFVLITGPSGAGKELAAHALAEMLGKRGRPLEVLSHNAARFTSEDEATATIFGVGARVFSAVDPRPGLMEQAAGGVLFLDEVHNLPGRVQRTLLRTLEDGTFSRIGETKVRPLEAHFVLASNAPAPDYGLTRDLLARLRVTIVPPLTDRIADIPEIFRHALEGALARNRSDAEEVLALIEADHFEAMCLDGFQDDNVRGILDLADRLASKIATGTSPREVIATVFTERFGRGPVAERYSKERLLTSTEERRGAATMGSDVTESSSHYEAHKDQIVAAYLQSKGNLSATERLLRSRGIRCTRRWIGIFVDKWGFR